LTTPEKKKELKTSNKGDDPEKDGHLKRHGRGKPNKGRLLESGMGRRNSNRRCG